MPRKCPNPALVSLRQDLSFREVRGRPLRRSSQASVTLPSSAGPSAPSLRSRPASFLKRKIMSNLTGVLRPSAIFRKARLGKRWARVAAEGSRGPAAPTVMFLTLSSNSICQLRLTSRITFSSSRPPAMVERIPRGRPLSQSGPSAFSCKRAGYAVGGLIEHSSQVIDSALHFRFLAICVARIQQNAMRCHRILGLPRRLRGPLQ